MIHKILSNLAPTTGDHDVAFAPRLTPDGMLALWSSGRSLYAKAVSFD